MSWPNPALFEDSEGAGVISEPPSNFTICMCPFSSGFLRFLVTKAANRKVGMVEKVFESLSSLELFNFTILSFGAQNLRKNQGNQAAANRKVEMVL